MAERTWLDAIATGDGMLISVEGQWCHIWMNNAWLWSQWGHPGAGASGHFDDKAQENGQSPLGLSSRSERRFDSPGGGKRLVMPSPGVRHTVVNGVMTVAEGKLVGAGRVRS